MGPEDPIVPMPNVKRERTGGRSKTSLTKETINQMLMQGGLPAMRGLVYMISKEIMKSGKMDPNRVKMFYLQAKALGIVAEIEEAGMDSLQGEVDKMSKKLNQPSSKTEEKPKFSEGSIDELRVL